MKHFNQNRNLGSWLMLGLLVLGIFSGYASAADITPNIAPNIAPYSLAGMSINLQIEKTVSKLSGGFANQGAVARRYGTDGTWQEDGAGGPSHVPAHGSFVYQRTGPNTAEETSVNTSFGNAGSLMRLHFETPSQGTWVMNWEHGQIIFSGSFSLLPAQSVSDLAPTSNAGQHVALIIESGLSSQFPPGSFPRRGLVLQTYHPDGSMLFQGFGPGTVNSRGTYTYKKLSANTAVEEVVQVNEHFSYPYTMVYTYLTPNSGKWFQNFGDGLIIFSGTFNTFPM